jgi:hypothetical protein
VGHEVQGKIKRGNAQHRAERKTLNCGGVWFASRRKIHRDGFTGNARTLFGGEAKRLNASVYFSPSVGQRFAGFLTQCLRKLIMPSGDAVTYSRQGSCFYVRGYGRKVWRSLFH